MEIGPGPFGGLRQAQGVIEFAFEINHVEIGPGPFGGLRQGSRGRTREFVFAWKSDQDPSGDCDILMAVIDWTPIARVRRNRTRTLRGIATAGLAGRFR